MRKILILDDEEEWRERCGEIAKEAGFGCYPVSDGNSAIEMLRGERFDAVSSDVIHKGPKARKIFQEAREHNPKAVTILHTYMEQPDEMADADFYVWKRGEPDRYGKILKSLVAVLGKMSPK